MTPTKPILDFAQHLLGGALTGMERKRLGVGESKARPEGGDLQLSELEPPDDLEIPKLLDPLIPIRRVFQARIRLRSPMTWTVRKTSTLVHIEVLTSMLFQWSG